MSELENPDLEKYFIKNKSEPLLFFKWLKLIAIYIGSCFLLWGFISVAFLDFFDESMPKFLWYVADWADMIIYFDTNVLFYVSFFITIY